MRRAVVYRRPRLGASIFPDKSIFQRSSGLPCWNRAAIREPRPTKYGGPSPGSWILAPDCHTPYRILRTLRTDLVAMDNAPNSIQGVPFEPVVHV